MPTVIICGTPGTGKSTIIDKLRPKLPEANFINLSKFAIEHACTSGYDNRLLSHIIDDDKLVRELEPVLASHDLNIVESIHADHVDADQIFVVRADTTKLYDRLKARGYNQEKIANNVEAEIFQIIYDEAVENYGPEAVIELTSNDLPDLEKCLSSLQHKISDLSS